jgi:hypothetical protein
LLINTQWADEGFWQSPHSEMTIFFEQLSDFLCIGGGGFQVLAVIGGGSF